MKKTLIATAVMMGLSSAVLAAPVGDDALVQFQNGTVTDANEINANFNTLKAASNATDQMATDNANEIAALGEKIAALEETLEAGDLTSLISRVDELETQLAAAKSLDVAGSCYYVEGLTEAKRTTYEGAGSIFEQDDFDAYVLSTYTKGWIELDETGTGSADIDLTTAELKVVGTPTGNGFTEDNVTTTTSVSDSLTWFEHETKGEQVVWVLIPGVGDVAFNITPGADTLTSLPMDTTSTQDAGYYEDSVTGGVMVAHRQDCDLYGTF